MIKEFKSNLDSILAEAGLPKTLRTQLGRQTASLHQCIFVRAEITALEENIGNLSTQAEVLENIARSLKRACDNLQVPELCREAQKLTTEARKLRGRISKYEKQIEVKQLYLRRNCLRFPV